MATECLPLPHLHSMQVNGVALLTDDALADAIGVRVAFTGRRGGCSKAPYNDLNLGVHVGDDREDVARNRDILLAALDAQEVSLIVPNQVHGTNLVSVAANEAHRCSREDFNAACAQAAEGADGVIVDASQVAALLCFADCVPVIIVSPTGSFAVVHAGWRGAIASIATLALEALAARAPQIEDFAAQCNVYLGPCIRRECFETGADVHARFAQKFGDGCIADATHIDLVEALRIDLQRAGVVPERIADSGICTVCSSQEYFSYRASGGICGRHGAIAFRKGE